jgi:DNA-binding protein H-NS
MSSTGHAALRKLIAQRAELDEQIRAMRAQMREGKLAEAIELIREFEFTAFELGLVKTQHIRASKKAPSTFPQKVPREPLPAMYQDPESGKTWSGRGRQPLWMHGDRDEYLIKQ